MENDPLIGRQLGAYYIQSKLGEGGMARVYKGYHARLRREVAIKVILSQIADQEGFKVRFEREAQLVASLQHPNIVAVYDFGDIGNLTYLVMQYVGGGTLRDQLRGGHALDPRQSILYCQQMARALHHAHLRGIVHRDVKPQNMLVSATGLNQLLLSDFGIAKLYDSRHEPTILDPAGSTLNNDPSLTNVDQIVGTAEYMSPEQINGKPVDARTDVYALGVVLYQMLTGEVPFYSTTVQGLLYQHVYTLPKPIREMNPYVPEILGQITARAMAKTPEDRFQSAEAMAQALETANAFATNQLSTPLSANLTSPAQDLTTPSQNRPYSNYSQPSNPAAPRAASQYGQSPAYAKTPPLPKPAHRANTVRYLSVALVILLALGLVLAKYIPIWLPPPTPQQTSFTETFQNNDRNWTIGTGNGLTASLDSTGYKLVISSPTPQTYFPHPGIGILPDNFTLTVTMEQISGSPIPYGLAFHWKDDGGKVYCYAFVVDTKGNYQVLKYHVDNPDNPGPPSILWMGQLSPFTNGLMVSHSLQAKVLGNKFSFEIDHKTASVNTPDQTITDNAYSGGQLAVLIGGTNQAYLVTSVQLTVL